MATHRHEITSEAMERAPARLLQEYLDAEAYFVAGGGVVYNSYEAMKDIYVFEAQGRAKPLERWYLVIRKFDQYKEAPSAHSKQVY